MLLPWGQETFAIGEAASTRLYTFLAIGIGAGSLLAGRLSGDKIELGLVPLGSIGLGVFSLLLLTVHAELLVRGAHRSHSSASPAASSRCRSTRCSSNGRPTTRRAACSRRTTSSTPSACSPRPDCSGCSAPCLHVTNGQIILIVGLFTLAGTVYVVLRVPDFFVRFALWLLTHTLYRITIVGRPEHPAARPGAHRLQPRLDGRRRARRRVRAALRALHGLRPVLPPAARPLADAPDARDSGDGRQPAAKSSRRIDRARAELEAGHVVCIFAEGAISRTGNLLPFKRGFERIVEGLDVPIIPVYLDRVWGSVFSFKRGRFFWKLPERLPYPVTVALGTPLPSTATATEVRQAIIELGSTAMAMRRRSRARACTSSSCGPRARRWSSLAMADSTGQKLTYGRALIGAFAVRPRASSVARPARRWSARCCRPRSAARWPTSRLLIAGKLPVNLNFTIGREALDLAIRRPASRRS